MNHLIKVSLKGKPFFSLPTSVLPKVQNSIDLSKSHFIDLDDFNQLEELNRIYYPFNLDQNIMLNLTKILDYKALEYKLAVPGDSHYLRESCILGAFLGDAMGAYYEFKLGNPNLFDPSVCMGSRQLVWKIMQGQITDDSEMSLMSGLSYLDGGLSEETLTYWHAYWRLTEPKHMGKTTKLALNAFKEPEPYSEYGIEYNSTVEPKNIIYHPKMTLQVAPYIKKLENSLSNGFLMRKAFPLVYASYTSKTEKLNDLSDTHIENTTAFEKIMRGDTMTTHFNPETHFVSQIYGLIGTRIMYLKEHHPQENIIKNTKDFVLAQLKKEESQVSQDMTLLLEGSQVEEFKFTPKDYKKEMGYYKKGMWLVLHFLNRIASGEELSYMDLMQETINLGGDTDTNCAIVGGIFGPYFGHETFPKDYLEILLRANPEEGTVFKRPIHMAAPFALSINKQIEKQSKNEYFLTDYSSKRSESARMYLEIASSHII